jgi:UDP-3-O-[3-hydroxymyristoyl] glucosamine N-acyltransferase
MTLDEIAALVGGRVQGDGGLFIRHVAGLDEVPPGAITFIEHARTVGRAEESGAEALLAPVGTVSRLPTVWVDHPRVAFARLLAAFYPPRRPDPGVHPTARVHPEARLHPGAHVGPFCRVGPQAILEKGVVLQARVSVGAASALGPDCWLGVGVQVGAGCRLGAGCILHPWTVLAPGADLGAEVEVGARAVLGRCTIGPGTKMDNLVLVGDGAVLGPGCLVVSQSMVSAGSRLGSFCIVAAHAATTPGVTVVDGVQIGGRAVAREDLLAPGPYSGDPARPHREDLRLEGLRGKAWDFIRRLRALAGPP